MSEIILIIPFVFFVVIYRLEDLIPHLTRGVIRTRHTAINLTIAFMGGLINLICLWSVITFVTKAVGAHRLGLLNQLDLSKWHRLFAAIVLFDLWMYIWHMMNHRIGLLWRLHRCHHNDIAMDSTTALRFHPIEIIFSQLFNLGVIVCLGLNLMELLVYNLFLQIIIFFHHSNIGLPEKWDRVFRTFFVTPNMHRVHHSIENFETNSNYGSIFSFWDRAFQSFRRREDTKSVEFGLPYLRESRWQNLSGFMKMPFIE